jgi:mRNA-degrading endonuclease toxin of MazEF toxin-antitoxin module
VKINQIRTLSVVRLGKKIAHLPPEILDQIIDGLNEIVA